MLDTCTYLHVAQQQDKSPVQDKSPNVRELRWQPAPLIEHTQKFKQPEQVFNNPEELSNAYYLPTICVETAQKQQRNVKIKLNFKTKVHWELLNNPFGGVLNGPRHRPGPRHWPGPCARVDYTRAFSTTAGRILGKL